MKKKKNRFCITSNRAEEIADKIKELYLNPDKAELLGKRARKVIEEEYSEAMLIKKYREVLNEVM